MSQVHRVLVLNKPFKIRGYTVVQWIILALSVSIALFVGTKLVPNAWKIGNTPAGLWAGIVIFGVGYCYVTATEAKPGIWWRNKVFYTLKLLPTLYLPKREEGVLYPDPTIKDIIKREDRSYTIEREG